MEKFFFRRRIKAVLNLFSNARICWLTALWVIAFSSAAFEKLAVSTKSRKILKVSICISLDRSQICNGFVSGPGYGRIIRLTPNNSAIGYNFVNRMLGDSLLRQAVKERFSLCLTAHSLHRLAMQAHL